MPEQPSRRGSRATRRNLPSQSRHAIAAAVLAGATAARADGVPGLRGHDHTGITVPDIKQAADFFINVLGCKEAMSFGPFADEKGNFMADLLNVNPRAVIHQITLVRCGYGSNIELFQYSSPEQKTVTPENSDVGGYHIAFYVDDIKAAKDYLDGKGVKTFFGPFPVNEGPAAGQSIVYFLAPWGLQMEIISYPKGMAYEKSAPVVLWSPRDPAK
jgi:catechol 2,3-dioxygenase-like lactoylglutathione lyase family enzyme